MPAYYMLATMSPTRVNILRISEDAATKEIPDRAPDFPRFTVEFTEEIRTDQFNKLFANWSEFMGQPIIVRVNDAGLAEAWVGDVD